MLDVSVKYALGITRVRPVPLHVAKGGESGETEGSADGEGDDDDTMKRMELRH